MAAEKGLPVTFEEIFLLREKLLKLGDRARDNGQELYELDQVFPALGAALRELAYQAAMKAMDRG